MRASLFVALASLFCRGMGSPRAWPLALAPGALIILQHVVLQARDRHRSTIVVVLTTGPWEVLDGDRCASLVDALHSYWCYDFQCHSALLQNSTTDHGSAFLSPFMTPEKPDELGSCRV